MLWEGEVEDSIQQFRIVVMYAVPSWKQVGSFKKAGTAFTTLTHASCVCYMHHVLLLGYQGVLLI